MPYRIFIEIMECDKNTLMNDLSLRNKKAELAEQVINEQLNAIIQSIAVGIWITDGYGNIITVNKVSEKLSGYKSADIIGKNAFQLDKEGAVDISSTIKAFQSRKTESVWQRINKTGKYILVTSTPIIDDNGHVKMIVTTEQDLTQLEALKEKLEYSRRLSSKYKQELSELNLMELRKQEIIAESKEMQQVLQTGLKLGGLGVSNILILGESGTGKGILSKFIHENSKRKGKPFIQVNCAAFPETLLEAELFGYEKGAFTGAHRDGKAGLFELADKGTLFLDEIGELPLSVQAKFLKYLDDQEILHLGGLTPFKVDCTVIAATNRDLKKQVQEGRFRDDLYYRLNAFTIKIPPLCMRKPDILGLANFFLKKYNQRYHTRKKFSSKALSRLLSYSFPGNIRELENLINEAVVLEEGQEIEEELLRRLASFEEVPPPSLPSAETTTSKSLSGQLQSLEKQLLKDALDQYKSTRKAAVFLGTSQSNIMRKLKKYGLKYS